MFKIHGNEETGRIINVKILYLLFNEIVAKQYWSMKIMYVRYYKFGKCMF